MEPSNALVNAQIHFLNTSLCFIHIPLDLYPAFLQPLLQLLLLAYEAPCPESTDQTNTNGAHAFKSGRPEFVNISVTSVECSVACPRELAEKLFLPVKDNLPVEIRDNVALSNQDYFVIQVEGQDLHAGERVLELSSPLALAGISIFFITTYTTDYILVPVRSRAHVEQALSDRGFAFEQDADAFTHTSSLASSYQRNSSALSLNELKAPSTPPPADIDELQARTFATLSRRNIVPSVDQSIRLVQCAARESPRPSSSGTGSFAALSFDSAVNLGLVKCLVSTPRFLSVTLTETESASILLEKGLLQHFPNAKDILNGADSGVLVPVTLNLQELPLESTGIVCGVAGRLVGSTMRDIGVNAVEMSYLSTARAGNVIVYEDELDRAVTALRGAQSSVSAPAEPA